MFVITHHEQMLKEGWTHIYNHEISSKSPDKNDYIRLSFMKYNWSIHHQVRQQ